MKQNITAEQLNELDDTAYWKLFKWYMARYYLEALPRTNTRKSYTERSAMPLLSIGQMIEFLDEDEFGVRHAGDGWWCNGYKKNELCDALWEACVEILNK